MAHAVRPAPAPADRRHLRRGRHGAAAAPPDRRASTSSSPRPGGCSITSAGGTRISTTSRCWSSTKRTACSTWAFCRMSDASLPPCRRPARACSSRPPCRTRSRTSSGGRPMRRPWSTWPRRATPVATVKQVVHPVAMTSKKELLATLLQRAEMGPTLVFTRTKARANQLARRLEKSGRQVAAIHGNKSQNARTRALARLPRRADRHADRDRHRRAGHRRRRDQPCDQLRSPAGPRGLHPSHRPHGAGRVERSRRLVGGAGGTAAPGRDRATRRDVDPTRDGGRIRRPARRRPARAPATVAARPSRRSGVTGERDTPTPRDRTGSVRAPGRTGGGARTRAPDRGPRGSASTTRLAPAATLKRYSSRWTSAMAMPLSPATAYSRKTRPLAASSKIAGSRSWLTCP